MNEKLCFISKIQEIQTIAEQYQFNSEDFENLKKEIEEFKVSTPIIGGFSSGKSSLINALLDENILKTSIKAETSIPTEIYYGSDDVIEIKSNGELINIKLDDLKDNDFNISKTRLIKVEKNNDFLKQISDIKLVDMPGFDSGIESHNKAIDSYLSNSLAYIITFEVGENIRESIADFLLELDLHNVPILIVITKCDKATQNDVNETVEFMKKNIPKYFKNNNVKIICTKAKRNRDIDEMKTFLIELQNQSEAIFKDKYNVKIDKKVSELQKYINSRINNNKLSISEIKEKETKLKKDMEKLIEKVDIEEQKFRNQIDSCISSIKTQIRADLMSSQSSIETMILNGQDINSKINVIIRNSVTNSIKSEFEPKLLKYFKNISKVLEMDMSLDTNIELDQFQVNMDNMVKDIIQKSIPAILAVLGGIFVGPLGAIIAGAIGVIVDTLFGIKKQNDKKAEVNRKVHQEIIPQISQQAGDAVETELLSYVEEINEEIKKTIIKEREVIQKSLDDIKVQKEKEEQQQKEEVKKLEQDLEVLKGIVNGI
ncbi:MAG: dynamin family protein [Paraclostridium sp.]